ncbi:MAG: phage terminase large subunit [Lachnospiraceae bacterium]|nr:phage terminase large subunit [Lachnospiraceae bacterium]MBR1567542.1 phage terminase large subunit [Lachnospiraceae bacterium]MBR1568698.1 phage terminase large subunit [Lachnospiraceae bacterium]
METQTIASQYRNRIRQEPTEDRYAAARGNLWEYEKLMNPKFFKDSRWHLKEIADTLQALVERRIIRIPPEKEWHIADQEEMEQLQMMEYEVCKNLILDIPPRHGKSYSLSQFEDWVFGVDPSTSIITVTYNEILAGRFSATVRDGIEATKIDDRFTVFSDVFPNIRVKQGDGSKQLWSLEGSHFSYLGTGFGGTITGIGCKIGVIDDPIKNDTEAFNQRIKDEQYKWYTDTFLSRIEDEGDGGIQIVNMTRWSTDDLVGRILAAEDGDEWYVLSYPACLDEAAGKMLCPELLSYKTYLKRKAKTSPTIFEANYNQRPFDVKGKLYKSFRTYDTLPVDTHDNSLLEMIKAYCDTADEGDDYLCNIIYGVYEMEAYVLDVIYTQKGMEETEPMVAQAYDMFRVDLADIESNNGGRGFARNVERILQKDLHTNHTVIEWFHQSANKIARIKSKSAWVQQHMLFPEDWADRWPEFYMTMNTFLGNGKDTHDDAADAVTGVAEKIEESDDWLF